MLKILLLLVVMALVIMVIMVMISMTVLVMEVAEVAVTCHFCVITVSSSMEMSRMSIWSLDLSFSSFRILILACSRRSSSSAKRAANLRLRQTIMILEIELTTDS